MMGWLKKARSPAPGLADAEADAARRRRFAAPGKYVALYKYLDNRYANTVVLTFGEIEDLLGFMLPDVAGLQTEWWTKAEPASCPWTLAHRTAKPNLLARSVVFDRTPS